MEDVASNRVLRSSSRRSPTETAPSSSGPPPSLSSPAEEPDPTRFSPSRDTAASSALDSGRLSRLSRPGAVRPSRRLPPPHPYSRPTRSSLRHASSPPHPPEETLPPSSSSSSSSSPASSSGGASSRRAARRNSNLDAASQRRLFLRRNLMPSPRLNADLGATAAASSADSPDSSVGSTIQRRLRGATAARGRNGGASTRAGGSVGGGATQGGQIDLIRERLQPTEARSRSNSVSSIIRARLTARISFGQRLGLLPSTSAAAAAAASASNSAAPGTTDRLTRNGARRAAAAANSAPSSSSPDSRDAAVPLPNLMGYGAGLPGIAPGAGVGRTPAERSALDGPRPERVADLAGNVGVLSGPGWSGTLDRTRGEEITVQIIDFGRIMGIPPYETQLLHNLQGQFQDMLHRSFHHSITSRNFEDIPQRVVAEGEEGKWEMVGEAEEEEKANDSTPSDTSISSTPTVPAPPPKADPARSCTICLMTPAVNEVLKTLPCSHCFHSDCLKQWFTDHATCPMCRDCSLCRITGAFNVTFSPS